MASQFRENASHLESDNPELSVHGGKGAAATSKNGADATEPAEGAGDASSIDFVQDKAPPAEPLTRKQKVMRHVKRHKWWYLAGAIILLAVILIVLFLAVLPAIVQRIIDNQSLPVESGAFVVESPTQVRVSLNTSLDTPIPAVLDTTTLFLYNRETPDFSPFMNVTIPETNIKGDTKITIDQQVTITNETEIEYWFNNVFDDPKVDLSLRGDSTIRLSSLHYKGHIEKTIQISSLDYLRGFGIQELSLILPALENGTNLRGVANLPNWGTLALSLGDVSFNLFSGEVRLGLVTLYDLVMQPGNNTPSFYGELFLPDLVQNFGKVLDAQSEALNNGQIRIDAVGNATLKDGQHIPFVENILNNKRIVSYTSVIKFASDIINSLTGGGTDSIVDVLGDVLGNNTLIEQALSHWNTSSTVAARQMNGTGFKKFNVKRTLTLMKLGKMMGKLRL